MSPGFLYVAFSKVLLKDHDRDGQITNGEKQVLIIGSESFRLLLLLLPAMRGGRRSCYKQEGDLSQDFIALLDVVARSNC